MKKVRARKHLTHQDIAVKLQFMGFEYNRITVSRIENGMSFVPDYEVLLLCNALEIPVNELYA